MWTLSLLAPLAGALAPSPQGSPAPIELAAVSRPQPAPLAAAPRAAVVVRLDALAYDEGAAPSFHGSLWASPQALAALAPYAVVDGARAAYLGLPTLDDWTLPREVLGAVELALELDAERADGAPLRGRLYLPDERAARLVAHSFTLAVGALAPATPEAFERVRARHHAWCFELGLPGAAWWRHFAGAPERAGDPRVLDGDLGFDRSFALLTGGRAVAENLRLDDVLRADGADVPTVPIGDLAGIRTPEIDWTGYPRCGDDGVDPLAAFVPADHHAVFFPSFGALVRVVDELRSNGTPVLDALEARTEDARVEARYEAQLALELDAAARLLGPRVVRSVALTGGDPYLRTGSDLALAFDCEEPDAFQAFLATRVAAASARAGVEPTERTVGACVLRGAADATRDLSTWSTRVGDVVIVSNSAPLAARMAGVARGDEGGLADLAEYRHFRSLYPRGAADEAAFLVLPDGAIRRWCGPKWRIASARRVRAGGFLAEASAAAAARRLGLESGPPRARAAVVADFGGLDLAADAPRSERYGTARFLTPVSELDFAYVTPEERDGYAQWRANYERQWSTAFDPIAARLSLAAGRLELDLTVMPIAVRSDYRDLVDFAGEARLAPDAGDPHAGALAHAVIALDRDARAVKQLEDLFGMIAPDLERPLGWIGGHAALWLDADPALLAAARAAEDPDEFFDEHGVELPVGVLVAVRDPLRLTAFLGGLKALLQSAAPGVMSWETREAQLPGGGTRAYVAIEPVEGTGWEDTPSLYYGIAPGRFVASLREDVVLRALERAGAPGSGDVVAAPAPAPVWLGESVAARFTEGFKEVLAAGFVERSLREVLQRRAFAALPILNELRRVAPDEDPRELLVRLFGSSVRCPGGGDFVWNDRHGTYESTVFGCPAEPRAGEVVPGPVRAMRSLELGVTFQRLDERNHALRARAAVTR